MKPENQHSYFYPEVRAGGFSRIDGTVQFYQRVNALLAPQDTVLDFGAGRGVGHVDDPVSYRRDLRNLKGKVREVIGADVDPAVTTNPSLDRAVLLDRDGLLPLPDNSVNLIVSDFTFEHIADPRKVAIELDRVLADGGWICARTPNRWGYIAIANRLIPASLRLRILKLMQPDREEQDVFPAFYRLNTRGALRTAFGPARFEYVVYEWDAEPDYGAKWRLLYIVFLIIHAVTPRALKTTLYVFMRKRGKSL